MVERFIITPFLLLHSLRFIQGARQFSISSPRACRRVETLISRGLGLGAHSILFVVVSSIVTDDSTGHLHQAPDSLINTSWTQQAGILTLLNTHLDREHNRITLVWCNSHTLDIVCIGGVAKNPNDGFETIRVIYLSAVLWNTRQKTKV